MTFLIILFWWSTERAGEPVQPDLPAARDHWLRALRGPGPEGDGARGVRGEDVPALQADQVQRYWYQYLVNEINYLHKYCTVTVDNMIMIYQWVCSRERF